MGEQQAGESTVRIPRAPSWAFVFAFGGVYNALTGSLLTAGLCAVASGLCWAVETR